MSVLETVKGWFTSEGMDQYECEDCEEVFRVEADTDDPTCEACGSADVTFISRV